MSQDQRLYDFFDGDPEIEAEYHQDYQGDPFVYFLQPSFVIPLVLAAIPAIYQIFYVLDYNLLSLSELLWNILVYTIPSRLLDASDRRTGALQTSNPMLNGLPRTHAMKSAAMRRILGMDESGGMMSTVASAGKRRLSTLPGMNFVIQGVEGSPAGLGNYDNSCYQNSVLQGLASLDSLSKYLTVPIGEGEGKEGMETPKLGMAKALQELITMLNSPENDGKRLWTPPMLKNMSSWQQQDAQEYFSKVLDEVDKEVDKAAKLAKISQGFESDNSSGSKSQSTLCPTTLRNPLEGMIAQRVGCTRCGYSEGLSMIPFNCLTVPLGRAWEYNVAECLDEYTKLEQIEGVECGKCTLLKTKHLFSTLEERNKDLPENSAIRLQVAERLTAVTEALDEDDYDEKTLLNKCKLRSSSRISSTKTRQAVIARPPMSLVVHFNRSVFDELTGDLRKNFAEVRFPKVLDLGYWCLGSSGWAQDLETEKWVLDPEEPMVASSLRPSRLRGPLYELRAVVTHYGRHENGHYICYRKHPGLPNDDGEEPVKEQWWRLSDDQVTKVSEETVLNQGGVFMLFFDLIEPAKMIYTEMDVTETAVEDAALSVPVEREADLIPVDEEEGDEASPQDLDPATQSSRPSFDDSDFSEDDTNGSEGSPRRAREESTATTVSECDEEETTEQQVQDYSPTKAIVVPQFIEPTGLHKEGEEAGKQGIVSSGNLVMV